MAKLTNPCTHGLSNETVDNLTVRGLFTCDAARGGGLDTSSFTVDAASTTTVTNPRVSTADSQIVVFGKNATAALLLHTKTCWVSDVYNGSFVFTVSASAAGAPDGTEIMAYITVNPTSPYE